MTEADFEGYTKFPAEWMSVPMLQSLYSEARRARESEAAEKAKVARLLEALKAVANVADGDESCWCPCSWCVGHPDQPQAACILARAAIDEARR